MQDIGAYTLVLPSLDHLKVSYLLSEMKGPCLLQHNTWQPAQLMAFRTLTLTLPAELITKQPRRKGHERDRILYDA